MSVVTPINSLPRLRMVPFWCLQNRILAAVSTTPSSNFLPSVVFAHPRTTSSSIPHSACVGSRFEGMPSALSSSFSTSFSTHPVSWRTSLTSRCISSCDPAGIAFANFFRVTFNSIAFLVIRLHLSGSATFVRSSTSCTSFAPMSSTFCSCSSRTGSSVSVCSSHCAYLCSSSGDRSMSNMTLVNVLVSPRFNAALGRTSIAIA